jgi:dienelactone hydrolase
MAEVVLFHHAQGLTDGVRAFAGDLEGHTVHTPDLYEGRTFATLDEGMANVREIGFDEIVRRGVAAAVDDAVFIGMSLGVLPAQALAQSHPSARGAVLLHGFVPPLDKVPAQVHLMEDDEVGAEDLEATAGFEGELFLYPGTTHLFTDRSLPDYDEQAARQATERILEFLDSV